MTDRWPQKFIWEETQVHETTLENGVVIRMECHFGEYDMNDFDRWCRAHPVATYTYDI